MRHTFWMLILILSCTINLFAQDADSYILSYGNNQYNIKSDIEFNIKTDKSSIVTKSNYTYKSIGQISLEDSNYYLNIQTTGPYLNGVPTETTQDRNAHIPYILNRSESIILGELNNPVFLNTDISKYSLIPQLSLPNNSISLKSTWEGQIYSPFFKNKITTVYTLLRVYGDIAVIEGHTKSIFNGKPIYDNKVLEAARYANGTRFSFDYNDNIGIADITSNSIYFFDMKEKHIKEATERFYITSILRPKDSNLNIYDAKEKFTYLNLDISIKHNLQTSK